MKNCRAIDNENGVSLVEVLASIVILSIILIFFINILIQSANTNKVSEEILDATYVAQTAMEEIYNLSFKNFIGKDGMKTELNYNFKSIESDWVIYEKEYKDYNINVKIEGFSETDVYRVIVEVYDDESSEKQLQAKMENALFWQEANEDEENNG